MANRAKYAHVNQGAIEALGGVNKFITTIDAKLRALVELRVSQINGCVYCIDMHSGQLRAVGETTQRIDCLSAWWETEDFYTDAERAALAWAESVTNVSTTHAPDEVYAELGKYFSEAQVVDLTLIVAPMNAWNRIAIGFRQLPRKKV
jgi:AhpD family alkylhydroperoxidase